MLADGVTVRKARVRGGADAIGARAALGAALDGAGAGVVPAPAILCVRTLADPRPGTLRLQGAAPDPSWAAAVRERLGQLARAAARPILGPVGAGAEAVLFADQAELLACLAREVSQGALSNWWLRAALGEGDLRRLLLCELRIAPHWIPAVFERAVALGAAPGLCSRLAAGEAAELLSLAARRFGLPSLADLLPAAGPVVPAAGWLDKARELAPEVFASPGGPAQRMLLATAVLIRRAPLHRVEPIAAAAREWFLEESRSPQPAGAAKVAVDRPLPLRAPASPVPAAADGRHASQAAPSPAARSLPVSPAPTAAAPAHDRAALPAARVPPSLQPPPQPLGPSPRSPDEAAADGAEPAPTEPISPNVADPPPAAAAGIAPAPGERPLLLPPRAIQLPSPPIAHRTRTGLGGVFYLLDLALALELYPDFTQPASPGLPLSPWDFLWLLAPALLGSRDEDPLWTLLAELAGRPPDQAPDFEPPPAWWIPESWAAVFEPVAAPDAPFFAHPRGFHLWDDGSAPGLPAPGIDRFIRHLADYARARLSLALGVPPAQVAPLVLVQPAEVAVTSGRVDVSFALPSLPLEVRLAGLDRDPGFLPAAGRAVYFHFE